MFIRKMKEEDLSMIEEMEQILFSSPWRLEDFLYEINENAFSHNYVVEDNNEIVGYVGLWIMYEQSQITTIGVHPKHQRKGIGQMMMEKMIEESLNNHCVTMSLEVRVSNDKAIALYKKYGFETVALRKNYYEDNHEDAYLMIKQMEV